MYVNGGSFDAILEKGRSSMNVDDGNSRRSLHHGKSFTIRQTNTLALTIQKRSRDIANVEFSPK